MDSLSLFRRDIASGLARQSVDEESAAHANLPVDTPDGEMNATFLQSLAPGEDVLIDAVHERPVQVEEQGRAILDAAIVPSAMMASSNA